MNQGIDSNDALYKFLDEKYSRDNQSNGKYETWFRDGDRLEVIRKYFEEKGCPFFLADDGGKFTVENNGENRGARAVVLWAPYMAPDEDFEDIIDLWHERKAVPFLVRTGCIPNKIGTEDTNCGHMELGALNGDLEMLNENDPCVHILDSNAIAFTAKSDEG